MVDGESVLKILIERFDFFFMFFFLRIIVFKSLHYGYQVTLIVRLNIV